MWGRYREELNAHIGTQPIAVLLLRELTQIWARRALLFLLAVPRNRDRLAPVCHVLVKTKKTKPKQKGAERWGRWGLGFRDGVRKQR